METEKEIVEYIISKLDLDFNVGKYSYKFKIGHMLDTDIYDIDLSVHLDCIFLIFSKTIGVDYDSERHDIASCKITSKEEADLAILKIKIVIQDLIVDQLKKTNNALNFLKS